MPRLAVHARPVVAAAIASLCVLAFVPSAGAQSGNDLLEKLKPWIKQQILGERPSESEAGTEAEAETPAADSEADEATASASDAPAEASGSAAGTLSGGTAAAPPIGSFGHATSEPEGEAAATLPDGTPASAPDDDSLASTGSLEGEQDFSNALPEVAPEAVTPPLRFAALAGRSASTTMATVGPIADEISASLGRPVELLVMSSYEAMIDAQVELRIDGGFYSAAAFALAESRCHCLEPIVAPRAWDGTMAYHAVIVARAGSGISSAFDLEGKTVAVGAADSIGARRMQLAGLMATGVDPAGLFGGVIETESARDAVRLVRDRRADAAFAWSSLEGDAGSGYTRGTLAQLVADGEIAMRDFSVVWRSAPITHGPFAVLKTLSDEEKDKIAALLVALDAARPDAYDLLNPFYGGGYAPVDPEDYRGLETLTAQDIDALSLPMVVSKRTEPEQQ
jgi:phosphonate transport system substrate-binding protein